MDILQKRTGKVAKEESGQLPQKEDVGDDPADTRKILY